jgi:hypothetical protein
VNAVVVTGRLLAVTTRLVGSSGHVVTELRVRVAPPGRQGAAEQGSVLVATAWRRKVAASVSGLTIGAPVTICGRLTSRSWNNRLYLEFIAEHVTTAAAPVAAVEPVEEAPAS